MGVVKRVTCDRCGAVIAEGAHDSAIPEGRRDIAVIIPWVGRDDGTDHLACATDDVGYTPRGMVLGYDDLCDGCRHSMLGYLSAAFKVDRGELAARARGNDGEQLKPTEPGDQRRKKAEPPTLPLTPKQADDRAAEDAVEQTVRSTPLDEGVQL